MASGLTHFIDIESAHTLLNRCSAIIRWFNFTKEIWLKGNHASVDEKKVGIICNQ
jgi:hypothetical protein